MGFEQINTADFDYQMMLATINAAYIGKAEITLSNYDNDSEPVIKVGAKIEVNGALIKLTTDDATPTGYTGITNSTTFYLYYDESAGVAIYSETVPVWNDALQGHYNGNDRAFFRMYKDSGGTLYIAKALLVPQGQLQTIVVPIGDWNMQSTAGINVAHGLSDFLKVRDAEVMIIPDTASGLNYNPLTVAGFFGFSPDNTNIVLSRATGEGFDDARYNDTSFNRGFITIVYEV